MKMENEPEKMFDGVSSFRSDLRKDPAGLLMVSPEELRARCGFGKRGWRIISRLEGEFARQGIGHWPSPLPASGSQTIFLYLDDSPIAERFRSNTEGPTDPSVGTTDSGEVI